MSIAYASEESLCLGICQIALLSCTSRPLDLTFKKEDRLHIFDSIF